MEENDTKNVKEVCQLSGFTHDDYYLTLQNLSQPLVLIPPSSRPFKIP